MTLPNERLLFLSLLVLLMSHPVSDSAFGQSEARPLMAYVGTFSSPLGDVLPTQVDLPPGNGRGIHLFHVNRETGKMTPAGRSRDGDQSQLRCAQCQGRPAVFVE